MAENIKKEIRKKTRLEYISKHLKNNIIYIMEVPSIKSMDVLNDSTNLAYSIGFFSETIIPIIVVFFIYKDTPNLITYIIGYYANILLNKTLKEWYREPRPKNLIKFLHSEKYTDIYRTYGMPSGHGQRAFYSLMYLYLCPYAFREKPTVLFIVSIIALFTMLQRVNYHYHTINQVIVGGLVGSLFAYLVIWTRKQILPLHL
jgi:membrane-associated phospholipid phosphatase